MSQNRQNPNPVPRLDLAPKLDRPLSLLNPLDYLRLLYWVFFFPQALRWYADAFCGGFVNPYPINWKKHWQLLRHNSVSRQLFIQGLLLTFAIPFAASKLLESTGFAASWWGVAVGALLGLWYGLTQGLAIGTLVSAVFGTTSGIALGLKGGFLIFVVFGTMLAMFLNVLFGCALSIQKPVGEDLTAQLPSSIENIENNIIKILGFILFTLVFLWLAANRDIAAVIMLVASIIGAILLGVAALVRLENWLLGLPAVWLNSQREIRHISHVTLLPIPFLSARIAHWLRQDWQMGLDNINHLLAYTLQFIPVIQAVNKVLAETPPEEVVVSVTQLAENPHRWRLVYAASASTIETIKLTHTKTRLDSPDRATAAGFWYLYRREPGKAVEAFGCYRSLPYGEELFVLAQTLESFQSANEIAEIAIAPVPATPSQPLLRLSTWRAIADLGIVIEDVRVVRRSASRFAKSFALNRALGKLKEILEEAKYLPQAERYLIIYIAKDWQKAILEVAGEVGKISIDKPVRNPYVIGDPVEGNLFVGREDIIRQLQELWWSDKPQSVVLFGHRRMGKTSILKNISNYLGSRVLLAYVNLLDVGDAPQGVGEVLMAIGDAISEAASVPPPADTDWLNLPYRTLKLYLQDVEAGLGDKVLIIALDEFERIEELINTGKIHPDFMGVLRGRVQASSKIAFAFAGLHVLEEMTEDYFNPFFASVIPIRVGFLTPKATHQLLANPSEDFPLDYEPEALDKIYALTAGQPYLVQLLGFQLVRQYNTGVFEMGYSPEPMLTVDAIAASDDSEFFERGRYYFTGVWNQATRGVPSEQEILRTLASGREGLSLDALTKAMEMKFGEIADKNLIQEALDNLQRHDVVLETNGNWHIIVELFRRWLLR